MEESDLVVLIQRMLKPHVNPNITRYNQLENIPEVSLKPLHISHLTGTGAR